jgi:outer membrane protein OmpA-like peptidoglycan-associated protein
MKNIQKTFSSFALAFTLVAPLAACATAMPPNELVLARAEFKKASTGEAGQLDPAQLHVAKESLDIAEKSFNDDPTSTETVDRSYVALRKTQLAEAQAGLAKAEGETARNKLAKGQQTETDLKDTKAALAGEQNRGAMTAQQLQQERDRRLEAEKRAKDAMDALALAKIPVKEEARGMVITLSGEVLFASAKWQLIGSATSQLDNVVSALKAAPERTVIIEGHTDSQGGHQYNMDLSQHRADSVRTYLIGRGIPEGSIRAVGIGPDRPVADNASAEGRANNRRVEIILSPVSPSGNPVK